MASYEPQQFSETFKTPLGQEVWTFLNERENLIRMETACYLSRPALEPLSPILGARFGDAVFEDRMKRMTGHMVRQILEAHGYRLDRTGVRITTEGNGYTTAARYTFASAGATQTRPGASFDGEAVDAPRDESSTSKT